MTQFGHKLSPLVKHLAAAVGGLKVVANGVGQNYLAHFVRRLRAIGNPITAVLREP